MRKNKEKIIKKCACKRKYTETQWRTLRYVGETTGIDGDVWEMRDCVCESTLMIRIS